jgi:hypothetical protein
VPPPDTVHDPAFGQHPSASRWGAANYALGVYDIVHVAHPCRSCGQTVERTLQIKYGACWAHELRPGDAITWTEGAGYVYGASMKGSGWIPAYSDRCPNCGDESDFADFAVIIADDLIVKTVQAPVGSRFVEDTGEAGIFPLAPDQNPKPVPVGKPRP